jgi:c-di-GMP-related signal transduction protein
MSIFLARQPIFDDAGATAAYELLFRSGWENAFTGGDRDAACEQTLHDSLMEFGLGALTGSKSAYFNMTRKALLEEKYAVLPKERVVLELLEDVEPDGAVLEACRSLKTAGYRLALDDFAFSQRHVPLVELADFVKIDFLATAAPERLSMVQKLASYPALLIAEKVEDRETFEEAKNLGFGMFQGFFFAKPEILSRSEVPRFKLGYLQFLKAIHKPQLDYQELEETIKQETSLSVKLLRFMNSAALGMSAEVTSIRRALMLLGESRLRKWASIVVLAGMGEDRPSELVVTGLIRARFCELLGERAVVGVRTLDLFLVGLLSVMDALLGRPLPEILRDLSISEETKQALVGTKSPLRQIYELAVAYERGDWPRIDAMVAEAGLRDWEMTTSYREAVEWANKVFGGAMN